MPKQLIDYSVLPVPKPPYAQIMSQEAFTLYMFYRGKTKPTERLISQFEEDFLGTYCKLEDFVWESLKNNLVFPQVQDIGLEVRHLDLEQIAYEWFNDTEFCNASYVALQPLPNQRNYFHVFGIEASRRKL
jgi:antirestriction protein